MQSLQEAVGLADESMAILGRLERDRDEQPSPPEESSACRSDPFGDWRGRLRMFQRDMGNACELLGNPERYMNTDLLILQGAAGTGKTHLLCDFASRRVEAGQPTVMLMGQRFTSTSDPWRQCLEQLDLQDLSAEAFVVALEAAAQAADTRALIIVDAVNEGRGLDIWPDNLPVFVRRLRQSPWIAILLAVRSTYAGSVIPDRVRENAVVVEHYGFQGNEYEAARAYFDHYGLEFPSTPVLHPEFGNPLFLKTICRGLRDTGKRRLPRGLRGISALFDLYLEAVHRRVSKSIDYDPGENLVREALERIATRMLEVGPWALTRRDAKRIVDEVLPSASYSASLYEALISEGVLLQDMTFTESEPNRELVYMTYERFADHVLADHLLTSHLDPQDPSAAFNEGEGLAFLTAGNRWPGLVEALCVQVPERCGQEFLQLAPELRRTPSTDNAFLQSIVWRASNAFSAGTFAVLNDLLTNGMPLEPVYDTLLTVTTVPDHPFNAETIDRYLRQSMMPDRDAAWSVYLHYSYGAQGPVDRLLDWATSRQTSDQGALEKEVVDLSVIALGWMLTSANRFVRDRATKGLVTLLDGRISAVQKLIRRFHDCDDPYVRERIFAVAYGVAMRCYDPEQAGSLASLVYERVFAAGRPPPHILLRDYARGVIERAIHLGSNFAADEQPFRPPYRSAWPAIPDDDELQQLAPNVDDRSTWKRGNPERARNLIWFSVMSGDFALYVIGTNHGASDWLSLTLKEDQWQSPRRALETFKLSLNDEIRRILTAMETAEISLSMMRWSFQIVGDIAEGEYREARRRAETARQRFLAAATAEQANEYEAIRQAQSDRAPTLDLSLIQRYVLWRVFELGWTTERFGRYDLSSDQRYQGRHARKPERFGKKYQWIAYHEILAHISDHYQYRDRYETDTANAHYQGPWQILERDIDPSWTLPVLPATRTPDDANPAWWAPTYSDWHKPADASQWLNAQDDLPDLGSLLRVRRADGTHWVNLRTLPIWTEPIPPNADQEIERREFWFLATAYFVDAMRVDGFFPWSQRVDFWNRWMPEPLGSLALYMGEHGWGPAFTHTLGTALDFTTPTGPDGSACPMPVRIAAFEYDTIAGDYDCSVENPRTLLLLHPAELDEMQLTWTGHGADYVDNYGELAVFDPAAHEAGPSALLIREGLLADYLERQRLSLVWAITAEKRVIPIDRNGSHNPISWSGSGRYTRHGVKGRLRLRKELTAADPK